MSDPFLHEHAVSTRRHFLQSGAAAILISQGMPAWADDRPQALQEAIADIETWLTKQDDFRDVSRGKPKPHRLDESARKEARLTRDTWRLQVTSDPDHPARIKSPLSDETDNALTFAQLVEMGKTKAVRFPKVMTCLNIGCPLGMGIWEGVPMQDVLWMTEPLENLRRVFYYGFHNNDPEQMFRSSLPVGRVLEDPFETPPVILCYKLNGEWLTPERGGPVRVVVPEAYGFKSIKWLTHLVLSNIPHANDTYAEKNNDVDSPMKTFCATLAFPSRPKPSMPIPISGWAQAGFAGLRKVQVWLHPADQPLAKDDPYYLKAPWVDAEILPFSEANIGGDLPSDQLSSDIFGFADSKPERWPMRLARAHWAILYPPQKPGAYILRCRTIDEKGHPQPLPRPFRKSGHAAIEQRRIVVEA